MKTIIEVAGSGCERCLASFKFIKGIVQVLRTDAEVRSDFGLNVKSDRGLEATPGIYINGVLKAWGRVPTEIELREWLSC